MLRAGTCWWSTRSATTASEGSVDVVGWRPDTRTLLIVEVKTRIVDLQDLLATMDRKRRLVPQLLAGDREWDASGVGLLLVVPSNSTARAVIRRHRAVFDAAFPQRTVEVRRWLHAPCGNLAAVWFLQDSHQPGIG